jgi:catechol 2,3-dioxygenase-like lactoylglutathione lyase family enzyme
MLELLGLRTVIYPAPDLRSATNWFTGLLGQEPYFEEPYYVGYNVAGYELALDPNADPEDGPRTYWGVSDAAVGLAALLAAGAEPLTEVTDVGDGIRVATAREPGGATIGIIENPHFAPSPPNHSNGPGR